MTVVPDASVILKWVKPPHDEPDADRALAIKRAFVDQQLEIALPSLWLYEIGNLITRKYPNRASDILRALCALDMQEAACADRWRSEAIRIATTTGATFYDAAYHAVAVVHDAILVTADSRYADRAEHLGHLRRLTSWSL